MAGRKPRVKIPKVIAAGDVVTIKTLISHRMESGQRKDEEGKIIPRHIINHFEAVYNGQVVFSVDIDPAVSANPYLKFSARIEKAGTFTMRWTDDAGEVVEHIQEVVLKG